LGSRTPAALDYFALVAAPDLDDAAREMVGRARHSGRKRLGNWRRQNDRRHVGGEQANGSLALLGRGARPNNCTIRRQAQQVYEIAADG